MLPSEKTPSIKSGGKQNEDYESACKRNPEHGADRLHRAEKFGDIITADHNIFKEENESRIHRQYSVVAQDVATQWIQRYPCKSKRAEETMSSFYFLKKILVLNTRTTLSSLSNRVRVSIGILIHQPA